MSAQTALKLPANHTAPISIATTAPKLTFEQRRILKLLGQHTYDEVHQRTGWSRGKIYNLAIRASARKTENRIRERHQERKRRQLEFLTEVMNTTAKCDVLDFLDGIPNDSVYTHITSLPYNLGKPYGDCPSADRMRFTYFHGWLMQIISELSRTLKPNGVLFLNIGSTPDWEDKLMPLDVLLFEDLRRSGLTFQSRVIWTTPHGLTPKRKLAERHETVLVFSKGDSPTFNPSAARMPQKQPGKRAFKGPNKGQLSCHPLGAHPTNVWHIPNVGHNHPERKAGGPHLHPAQFPLTLAKRAILLYSLPGELICDVFSGSGTTHVGAIETGRAFIGADLFYEDLRANRLVHTSPDTLSILPGVTDQSIAVWEAEVRKIETPATPITQATEKQQIQELFLWDKP